MRQIHHHRAARVGHVGDVQAAVDAARQVPDQPGVDVAEDEIPGFGLLTGAVDVLEDPADLRARRSRWRAAVPTCPGNGPGPRLGELIDDLVGARVLPDERVVDRLAGGLVPDHRGLALVGDPERGDVVLGGARLVQRLLQHLLGSAPRSPWHRARPSPAWDRSARAPSGRPRPPVRSGQRSSRASWSCPGRLQPRTSPLSASFRVLLRSCQLAGAALPPAS